MRTGDGVEGTDVSSQCLSALCTKNIMLKLGSCHSEWPRNWTKFVCMCHILNMEDYTHALLNNLQSTLPRPQLHSTRLLGWTLQAPNQTGFCSAMPNLQANCTRSPRGTEIYGRLCFKHTDGPCLKTQGFTRRPMLTQSRCDERRTGWCAFPPHSITSFCAHLVP